MKYQEDMPPPEESSAGQAAAAPVLNFTSNFPVPNPMKVSSNRVTNCELFRRTKRPVKRNKKKKHKTIKVRDNKLNRRFGVDITPLSR